MAPRHLLQSRRYPFMWGMEMWADWGRMWSTSGAGSDWSFHWPSVGTWVRHRLHHCLSATPQLWHHQITENQLDFWECIQLPVSKRDWWGVWGECLLLRQISHAWLRCFFFAAPGLRWARAVWLTFLLVTGKLSKIALNPCQASPWIFYSMTLNILDKPGSSNSLALRIIELGLLS